jgi:hypothetical protein
MLMPKRIRVVVTLAAAVVGLALQSGPAFAASTEPQISGSLVKISNNGTCLDWDYDFQSCAQGASTQKWTEVAATGGTYKFEFEQGLAFCLDGTYWPHFGTSACAQGDGAQRWTLISSTGGTWKIEQDEGGTRICLDASTFGSNQDAFHPCAQGDGAQRWTINPAS